MVNGDAVLLMSARDMKARGALPGETVVATTMSNMGLEIALRNSGIRLLRANVGDKYVLEEMRKSGAALGGEQSGHIIFRDGEATTGDGLLDCAARDGNHGAHRKTASRTGERSQRSSRRPFRMYECARKFRSRKCRRFRRRSTPPSAN